MGAEKFDSVKTAGRTIDLFEVFARVRSPISLSELAHQIGSPLSSTHGLVKTLRDRGYVYSLDERKLIYPTRRLLAIATLIAEHDPVVELILPTLRRAQERSDETLIVGKRQGDQIIYLEVIEGASTIRYSANAGDTKPMHSSAIGKAFLSLLAEDVLEITLESLTRARVTDRTITDAQILSEDIAEGRKRGYFRTRGENVEDVMALALPIRVGAETLAVALAGPAERMARKEASCATILRETAAIIADLVPD